jgi:DNA-binding transcriptional MerR regulator
MARSGTAFEVEETAMSAAVERLYTITELSDEVGATARAIRFYESKGLLSPRRVGANRVYDYRDRARLLIILRGKRLGFSLSRIQEYLSLYDADPTHKGQLEHLLAGTQRRIEELEAQRADLELTIEELREIEELTLDAIAKLPETQRRKNSRKR